MAAVTALREAIAAAIDNPTVWQVFSYPPASPLANSVIVSPDDPYIEPTNQYSPVKPLANFKLTLIVQLFDNNGNLNYIEDYMVDLFNKLSASNLNIRFGSFTAPSTLPVDAGQMLATDLSISILTDWS
jgi:hypothetical protein